MRVIVLTTIFLASTAHAALARPPLAELDGRAPFIGPELTTSQIETVRTITAAWRRAAAVAHATLVHLAREEEDLVEASGPVELTSLNAVLAHEEAIEEGLATQRIRNEIAIHDLLSSEQLTEAARTIVVWDRPIRTASGAVKVGDSVAAAR